MESQSDARPMFSGTMTVSTTKEVIDSFYREGEIGVDVLPSVFKFEKKQNIYIILTDKVFNERREEIVAGTSSAIGRVVGNKLKRLCVDKKTCITGIKAKNKEQEMAMDSLLDPNVEVVSLTGTAGTGKTLVVLASAIHLIEQGFYDKIIISRQMTQVGDIELGILPGEVNEKVNPYLLNYMGAFSYLLGRNRREGKVTMEEVVNRYHVDVVPFQLIRGCSWLRSLVIIDEFQNCTGHEILTLGTRVGEGSKLVMMGDLGQRDINITKENTGLYKWINSPIAQESKLVSSVHLIKSERSEVCKLFAKVFED